MIRDFRCPKCDKVTEKTVKSGIDAIRCPVCREWAVKIPSVASFVLKGKGFYKNDYKEKKNG